MVYLHEELLGNHLIRRWANEIDDTSNAEYGVPTYQVHKLGTMEYYDEAVDLVNSERTRLGLSPFYYEATDIQIVDEDNEVEEDTDNG